MSHGVGFNNGMRNNSEALRINLSPAISFRPENLEFELRPRYGLQYTHNSIPTNSSNKPTVHNFGGSFSAYYRTPVDIILASDVTYTATRGYSQGYNKNEWLWNASVSYETLRDKSLTLSVKAYDLLNQQSNISRTSTGNYIQDQRFNSLTRYFMFSVSYRFNTFGKGNEPGSRNRRGPGGFGGHGPGGHGGPGRRM